MGRHRWGRDGKRGTVIEREVPPIVTEATWNAAQTWLTANKKFSPRNPKNAYLLKGLVRCARCGYTFIGTQWKNGKKAEGVHRAYLAKQDDRQRLTTLFRKGLIDERDMEEHLAEVTRKEAELNAEAQVLRARVADSEGTEISLHAADVLLHGMHASTDQPLTLLAKRHILSVFLKGILVDWEGRQPIVSVHYRFQVPRAPDRGRNSKCA
jgi:hypothetical protein